MRNNRDALGRPTFFAELTPLSNAIKGIAKKSRLADGWNREVFAKDDDERRDAAQAKRDRRAQRNIKNRKEK